MPVSSLRDPGNISASGSGSCILLRRFLISSEVSQVCGWARVEDAAGDLGQTRRFLEDIALEPLHGPVHVVGPDVEQRGAGIVDVLVGGSVADAERGPVV